MVGVADCHGAGAGDCRAGGVARGAHLRLQHDHGAADAGRNRAGTARAALRQAATVELQFLRSAWLQFDFQPGHRRRAEHAIVRGRRVVAGGNDDSDAGGLRNFHVADSSVADRGVPVRVAAAVVAGAFLFGAAASGVPAQPRPDGQHGFAVQRERARDADGERLRRGTAPGPAVRGGERSGVVATTENFPGPVGVHAGHADVVAIEPGDFVCLRRLAVCAGENSAGRRAGGVCGIAPAIHRTGGDHLDHRELGATEPRGGAARVRGDGHTGGSAEPDGRHPAAPAHGPDGL